MRILFADDKVLLREGVARLLSDAGIDVSATVGTADALLAAVTRTAPDVVLVDFRMPPGHSDINRIMRKLGIPESTDANRRVLAVLAYLRSA